MLSAIRKRLTYANVAMTLALVFAMTGGAYAANKYLITSTKQISPKVLKALKGHNGANGANGSAGPAGATGAAGPQGPVGAAGAAGAKGETGTPGSAGTNGKNGANGTNGSPWTASGILPAEATETGTWVATTIKDTEKEAIAVVSFPIPLKAALPPLNTHFVSVKLVTEGKIPAGCSGTAAEPKAEKGNLCVFEGLPEGAVESNNILTTGPVPVSGAGKTGAVLGLGLKEAGGFATGTWAVTGE